ncbi:MAG: MoaD/ThiS family protein [Planctomycetaceae bacterium]|nr:MoaD/ThiS family protein [Planctomycetaceae bacterium]
MKIKLQYTTQLKVALGLAEEEVTMADGCTLPELFSYLASTHGQPFTEHVLDAQGQLRPAIIVCVNDCQVDLSKEAVLDDGATVTLLSAISGG